MTTRRKSIVNSLSYFPKYLLLNSEGNTTIRCIAHVMSVYEIDTVRQRFECKFYLQLRWVVTKFNMPKHEEEDFWEPQIDYINAMGEIKEIVKTLEKVDLDENFVEVIQTFVVQGRFYERFEVYHFPFDTQNLQIYLCLRNCPSNIIFSNSVSVDTIKKTGQVGHIILKMDSESNGSGSDDMLSNLFTTASPMMNHVYIEYDEIDIPGKITLYNCGSSVYKENIVQSDCWRILNAQHVSLRQGKTMATRHDKGISFTTLRIVMTLERRYGFFFWNIIFPTCILVNLSFTSFFLSTNDLVERLTITITLILTMIAVKFTVAQYLPPTNYLTILDKYVVTSFMTLSAVAAQNILCYIVYIHTTNSSYTDKLFNIVSASFVMCIYTLANIFQFLLFNRKFRVYYFERWGKKIIDHIYEMESPIPTMTEIRM